MHFDMPAGIRKQLAAEVKAHGYSQVQELWQDLALSWIAQDAEERARRLRKPDAPAFSDIARACASVQSDQHGRAETRS